MGLIGREIEATTSHSLTSLLREHRDVFSFKPEKMPGINPAVVENRWNVDHFTS